MKQKDLETTPANRPSTLEWDGQAYKLLPEAPRYYVSDGGDVLSVCHGKPRPLKPALVRGVWCYYLYIGGDGSKKHYSKNRLAYAIQKGVPLASLEGKQVFREKSGTLVAGGAARHAEALRRMRRHRPPVPAAEALAAVRRQQRFLAALEAYYGKGDIGPVRKALEPLRPSLEAYARTTYEGLGAGYGEIAEETLSLFLQRVCECRIVAAAPLAYMKKLMRLAAETAADRRSEDLDRIRPGTCGGYDDDDDDDGGLPDANWM